MNNIKVHVPGKEDILKKQRGANALAPKRITKYQMMQWINNAAIDEITKETLLEELNRYPANTMHHFYDNIHKHIERIHTERLKRDRENQQLLNEEKNKED